MNHRLPSPLASALPPLAGRQRGVVMFIALLVMVALSLAGIALIRSADTATVVSGNLAFKQAAVYAIDRSVEQSINALFEATPPLIADKTVDSPAQNYYACVRNAANTGCVAPADPIPEVPTALANRAAFAAAGLNVAAVDAAKDSADNKAYYVIERMCSAAGPPIGANCNVSTIGLGAEAGTQHYEGLVSAGDAFYRLTVRVEGPRNTVAHGQAMLQ